MEGQRKVSGRSLKVVEGNGMSCKVSGRSWKVVEGHRGS